MRKVLSRLFWVMYTRTSVAPHWNELSTNSHKADVVVIPPIGHLRPDEIKKRDEFITLGEEAARANIDAIKELCGL